MHLEGEYRRGGERERESERERECGERMTMRRRILL